MKSIFSHQTHKKTPISVACIPISLLTCLDCNWVLNHSKNAPLSAKPSSYKNPWKFISKTPYLKYKIKKRGGVPEEPLCMHDKNLPKGPKNPCLREENKTSHGSTKISKENLKKKVVRAEIFQKWCPWKAWRLGKRMVKFVFQFGLDLMGMHRREGEKKGEASFGFRCSKTKWRRRRSMDDGFMNNGLSELWAPMAPKLQGQTIICGSRMRSTKERKMIMEKSSFQKVYFPHGFQISKIMHKFGVKSPFCPFFLEKRNF